MLIHPDSVLGGVKLSKWANYSSKHNATNFSEVQFCGIIVVGKIGGDDYLKQSVVQSTSSNHLKTFAESKSALLKFEYILVVIL